MKQERRVAHYVRHVVHAAFSILILARHKCRQVARQRSQHASPSHAFAPIVVPVFPSTESHGAGPLRQRRGRQQLHAWLVGVEMGRHLVILIFGLEKKNDFQEKTLFPNDSQMQTHPPNAKKKNYNAVTLFKNC
jgi:hypothetical protein